ncbi:acyl-CoA dehydrogenase [Persicitalea jodogahamensis]|uniref:Acyl-CoA dehydrogenase n=1 Tax=Persicitalea jodogahamensis TaxID=402147 RepID=A0A8J3G8V7_9BACT|nr:acyl-CoA dehydrogenase [Persicitalea jodogahamensis]GHB69632.1 acyl-CoA dehydrogenase [Persicitalea jodogahamensis]
MPQYFDRRNLDFLLYEVHDAPELTKYLYFEAHDRETFDLVLDSVTQIADTLMHPHYRDVDRNPPELKDGKVTVHPQIKPFLKAVGEGGLIGAGFPFGKGGQQLPEMVGACVDFIQMAANNGMMYTGLTSGAANLIATFGSPALVDAYVAKMLGGQWQGTMALTEPQAGSSLSDITTTAEPQPDGSYRITGQKVFISAGDLDAVDNVVHLMLVRIKGAPKGTKGISLFVVPKFRLEEDGSFVDNDVTSTGIYHKLGQRGTPAMHLTMGDRGDCHGWLLGEANRGLSYMFQMMNEARIAVGITGAAIASAAYCASLEYARERPQSRRLNEKNQLDSPQTMIINHPDVKRMLLFQKAIVEGSLSLLLESARLSDLAHVSKGEEKENYTLLLELLTPVAKTFPTEMGVRSVNEGLQVLGGYGFTEDFPLEQMYRDIRITTIYEGTTGIQSQDLLGRKMTIQGGKAPRLLFAEIDKTITEANTHETLQPYAKMLGEEIQRLQKVTSTLLPFAQQGDYERFLMDATLYMELFGLVTVAWQWLKQGIVAQNALSDNSPGESNTDFYEGKIQTMKYYFHYEVPKTLGLAKRLQDPEVLTIVKEREVKM